MSGKTGFTLVEFLVAATILAILATGVGAIVRPAPSTSRATASAVDIGERLRAAIEAVRADLLVAGEGPVNGAFARPLGAVTATVLPFRVGPRGDPDATARTDALTVLSAPPRGASAPLAVAWTPGAGPATIAPGPACPSADASCGFRAGGAVLLIDGRGQADLFRVEAATGPALSLAPRGRTSGRAFPVGSAVVPVVVASYYFKSGTTAEGSQLMSGDGDQSDLPLADHVTRLSFELFGEPRAPALGSSGATSASSYGPVPPPVGEDDPRDTWGAGENCVFASAASGQVSRLPPLGPGTRLEPLPVSLLTDGPWCPDASAPGRYDADLLRVRAVRVTLRLEAGSVAARGRDPTLFAHPGTFRDQTAASADRQLAVDVVPRALQRGR